METQQLNATHLPELGLGPEKRLCGVCFFAKRTPGKQMTTSDEGLWTEDRLREVTDFTECTVLAKRAHLFLGNAQRPTEVMSLASANFQTVQETGKNNQPTGVQR